MKSKLILTLFAFLFSVGIAKSQDTITVNTLNYKSNTRDTIIEFPSGNDTYQKIIMLYNMRCKNNAVSDGNNRNRGCGEWDYSCNTYITDSAKIDSLISSTADYKVSQFSGSEFNYSLTPSYDIHRTSNINTTVDSSKNVNASTIGTFTGSYFELLSLNQEPSVGKNQFLYSAHELKQAGISAGKINALYLQSFVGGYDIGHVSIKLKATSQDSLGLANMETTGFKEVFSKTVWLEIDTNKFEFNQPFVWDGLSNIIVEVSYAGKYKGLAPVLFRADYQDTVKTLQTNTASSIYMDGSTYVSANGYKGITGNADRTIDAWIKTSTVKGEICSWGKNASGQKWVFRINDNGALRVEVNGGNIVGSTILTDNKWHHVACVFSGSQVSNIKLYVDGNLETVASSTNYNINTVEDIDVRISRGVNNRYFVGNIDEVRLWSKAFSASGIKSLMRGIPKDMDNLEFFYSFHELENGNTVQSNFVSRPATVFGNARLQQQRFYEIEKEFFENNLRLVTTFVSGDYFVTNDTLYSYDSIAHPANTVIQYEVLRKYNTIGSDLINPVDTNYYWNADNKTVFYDETGVQYGDKAINKDGSITIGTMAYMRRWPSTFEIMSFVTPYGIGLNLGAEGKTWTFDVTDFAPLLKGKKRFYLSRGGQNQEEMDIKFLFIKGTPGREVLDIRQIWPTAQYTANYNQIINNDVYFPPVSYPTLSNAKGFKIRSAITGHGQQGEFIPRNHFISMNDTTFSRTVWKTCGDNPVYPQGGTWIYDRAGWCPGMATDVAEYDITGKVNGGDLLTLDYGVTDGSGDSRYIVNNQIVSYGDYNFKIDGDLVDIMEPSTKIEYGRENPMCINPKALVRNNGSELMTSITLDYWVNDKNNKKTFTWPCHLRPGGIETVYFPVDNSVWSSAIEGNSIFTAEITAVNGVADENSDNNIYHSPFDFPDMYPSAIYLFYRTNNAASETSIILYDEWGKIKFHKTNLSNSTLYRDTLYLGLGCYQLRIDDSDGDGISFWANSDGSGFFRIVEVGGSTLKVFNGDFGNKTTVNFTVAHKLDIPERTIDYGYKCYPNPASDRLVIEGYDLKNTKYSILNNLGQEVNFNAVLDETQIVLNIENQPSGMYFVKLEKDGIVWTTKVFIQ
jgi:hypothetical protein